jgi:hypothetical protein
MTVMSTRSEQESHCVRERVRLAFVQSSALLKLKSLCPNLIPVAKLSSAQEMYEATSVSIETAGATVSAKRRAGAGAGPLIDRGFIGRTTKISSRDGCGPIKARRKRVATIALVKRKRIKMSSGVLYYEPRVRRALESASVAGKR